VQAGRHDGEDATGHQWRRWAVSRANFRVLGLLGSYLPANNIRELRGVVTATWWQAVARRWERHNIEFNMEAVWRSGVDAANR
jgi:hypothetical protein